MHKCIMVKISGRENSKLSQKTEIERKYGELVNSVEIGEYAIGIIDLGGKDALAKK